MTLSLHFLRPWWLLALLALPLLAWLWRRARLQRTPWRDVVDPHLLPHLLAAGARRGDAARWVAFAAATLAILALAGPSWRQEAQPLLQDRAPLVVAVDLSSATLANDLPPSRLLQARAKIASLLRARAGGQVGLVAFADDAFTVAPLTDDIANVALFLDALAPDVMPVDGSRADRAIARSARLLRQAGFSRGDIVLLTDHTGGDAVAAARSAAADGFRVSAIGLGTAAGSAYRTPEGGIAQAKLDADALRSLASAGDGGYAALSVGDADLRTIGVLDPASADAQSAQGEKARVRQDGGYWLLPPLMLLALFAFRRGGVLAALLLCLWLPMRPAHAADGTLWRRADQRAHARAQAGTEAYRKGDFAAAARAFGGVDGADGQYNLGNALAKQGRYEDAVAAYDRALRTQPGMGDAIANRKAVLDAMKRKPPPSGGPQNRQQKQQRGQSTPQPGTQGSPQDDRDGQRSKDASQPSQSPPQRAPQRGQAAQPPQDASATQQKPADAAEQRAADAAQRQRMQQAVQKQPSARGKATAGQPRQETAQQREQRLANEAWLRRVPDDPGGLLRAKFELEYERRQREGGE